MEPGLLRTKIFVPPPRPGLVARKDLVRRLHEGLELGKKLTLVAAPVGYGKTTLVSEWLSTLDCPVAWFSVDEGDSDPGRFWTYAIAALQTIQPEFGQSALALLQKAQTPPTENLLTDLVNQISALPDKIILVIDDYHLIETTTVHQGLNFLLEYLPPQLHLVLITREDPPLPLPQMRGKGQVVELRIKDLRFNMEESAEFLNQKMGLKLQPEEISTLGHRTEGWAAGLQMAALSLHELDKPDVFIKAFAGDNRYVTDYLISEVLDRQPDHIRQFLLQTAIVDRFTAPLCATLIGDTSQQSSRIIEKIEARGLFIIPLDHVRKWYRYHQLFADLLRYRLRQNDPSKFTELNRIASRWYEKQGLVEEAVKYALVGEDHEYVAELIEETGLTMIGQSQLATLQNWINALPEKIVRKHPYLSVLLVWVGALTGQGDLARKQLVLAEQNLSAAKAGLRSEIICQIELLRAYASRTGGDLDSSIKHAQKALSYLPENNVFLDCTIRLNLGGNYWLKGGFLAVEEPLKHVISFIDFAEVEYPALAAAGFLANAYLQQGKLRNAEALCKKIVEHESHHAHPAAAYVFLELGELLYERNDLDGALDTLLRTIRIGERVDKVVNVIRARQLLARVYQALGNQEEAAKLMAQADELFTQASPRHQVMHQIEYEYYRVCCLLDQENMQPALQWADNYAKKRNTISNPWALLNDLTYAHLLLTDGRPDQAISILKPCEISARSHGAIGWVVKILALQSLCYQAANDLERGMASLRSALSLAEPEIYVRTFVDCGAPMQQLLGQAAKIDLFPGYVARLLTAFPAAEREKGSAAQVKVPLPKTLVEPLTDRELGILRLMAAGLSHHEIASELFLSVNTIKWHTTHIYSKLGVHRRAHAVTRSQELGIL